MKKRNYHTENFNNKENKVWKAFIKGDVQALSYIFNSYYDLLFHYGNKFSFEEKLTEDCIQDIFFLLWRDRKKLGDVYSIKAYLFKSLRRRILRKKKEDTRNREAGFDAMINEEIREFSFEDTMISHDREDQQKKEIKRALDHLSNRQKEVLYLRFHKDLSYSEISEITETSTNTIRNQIHQSLKIIRGSINNGKGDFLTQKLFK